MKIKSTSIKKSFIISLGVLFFAKALYADSSPQWHLNQSEDGWNNEQLVLQYFHHSELQRQWAWHLLACHSFSGHEHVLDFGCGDGKITAEVSNFVPQGSILGIDSSWPMINFAQCCFPSIYYPGLEFKQMTDDQLITTGLDKKYDLIYACCVFHIIAHPVEVLKNLKTCLSPDGKLLLVIPSGNNKAFFQAANEIFNKYQLTPPWTSHQQLSLTMRTEQGCRECLVAAGLCPLSIVMLNTPTVFFNKQELIEWMIGTTTANWNIPLDIAPAFFSDIVDRMAELDPELIDHYGSYIMKLSRLEVIAQPA